ncbi:MAG TPA: DnaJ domain-containing protein [Candidatus Methylomirabilis sp.]|nr:DnaJ domain-containing protein [Candidatus Methylomirabilis sp.]
MARTNFGKDYYAILEIPREATEAEIRKAYRRLALEWHPDRRQGDPRAADRFKEISEAYAALINPARRREYDEAARTGAASEFRHSQEDLLRDLFADPRASSIFEELTREFQRMGMRVDGHTFRHTLFGGRAVVVGGVFVISPLTILPPLFRIARAALGGARATAPVASPEARSLPEEKPGLLATIARVGRSLFARSGSAAPVPAGDAPEDVTLALRLTRREAEVGGPRPVSIDWARGREEVKVTIPPGLRPGTRLRLRGKGRTRGDGSRGDAYLVVEIVDRS